MDCVTDLQERELGTDPNNPDTDGDGFYDGPGSGGPSFTCRGDADPNPLDPSVTGNEQPSIDTFDVDIIGFQATLDLRVSDVNNNLAGAVIEWGDDTGDTITSGFGDIAITHSYPD